MAHMLFTKLPINKIARHFLYYAKKIVHCFDIISAGKIQFPVLYTIVDNMILFIFCRTYIKVIYITYCRMQNISMLSNKNIT